MIKQFPWTELRFVGCVSAVWEKVEMGDARSWGDISVGKEGALGFGNKVQCSLQE